MKAVLPRSVTHREFLKMIGLAVAGAGAGQLVATPTPALAIDATYDNLTVYGNTFLATTSGKAGIGTSTPQSRLAVFGSNAFNEPYPATLAIGRRPDGAAASLGVWYSSALGWHLDVDSSGNIGFFAYNGGAWAGQVSFLSNGKVGIGTTAPIPSFTW